MRWLADFFYLIAALIYLPVAVYNAVVLGKNRHGWRERLGFVPRFEPARERIWIHAVSLGETNATTRLVAELRQRLPDADIVFSSTTDTGFTRATELYGPDKVFRFPLDFSFVITATLRRIKPTMIVLVEQEVWHNLTRMSAARCIPIVVVNGRLTERSAGRLSLLGAAARGMFSKLTWVGAQDEAIADRFAKVGVLRERIEVTSSLKWDTAMVADRIPGKDALAAAMGIPAAAPLWVCGSTGPGEEEIILNAYATVLDTWRKRYAADANISEVPPAPLLCIVPRKPERFDEVAAMITRHGFACTRRSVTPDGAQTAPSSGPRVLLGDTMGELRKWYSLCAVAFVGRSLVPMGGSDPMEVAALGKPILAGPHMENFAEPAAALKNAATLQTVVHPDKLATDVTTLLCNPDAAKAMGACGRSVVVSRQGATRRTAERLVEILRAS